VSDELTHLEVSGHRGLRLRVAFGWNRDRFLHSIAVCSLSHETVMLRTREGDELDAWPPSPPLQQLSAVHLPNGNRGLLLIGMAGRTHWSLSVTPDVSPRGLLFDVACRSNLLPVRLGSSYRLLVPHDAPTGNSLVIRTGLAHGRVLIDSGHDEPPAELVVSDNEMTIAPSLQSPLLPATFRWKYRVGWPEPSDE